MKIVSTLTSSEKPNQFTIEQFVVIVNKKCDFRLLEIDTNRIKIINNSGYKYTEYLSLLILIVNSADYNDIINPYGICVWQYDDHDNRVISLRNIKTAINAVENTPDDWENIVITLSK